MLPNLILLTNTRGSVWQRSLGAYQVAHHCRENGYNVQVIDFTDFFDKQELVDIIKKLLSDKLLAVGISTTFYSTIDEDDDPKLSVNAGSNLRGDVVIDEKLSAVFNAVKTFNSNIKIIAGGANSWQAVGNLTFDAVFHGYSEQSVVEYLETLQHKRPKSIHPKIKHQEIVNGDLTYFDIENLNHRYTANDVILRGETLPIEIGRGCIFKCKFCSYPLNGKKKNDYIRNYDLLKEELEYNYKEFGVTNYFFTDDTFNDSTDKIRALHKVFTSLSFKIGFVCYLRVDLLHRHSEQILLLKEMGLNSVVFGVESLHHGAAKAIGKGMNPEKLKKFLLDLYYTHWEESVSITCSMIIGLPGETEEHVREVHAWFRNEGKDLCDSWWPLTISTKGHYLSAFDKEYTKYKYTLIDDGWVSPTMTYRQAFNLSQEFNHIGMYRDNHPGSWMIEALLSYGYTLHELMNWQVKDMPWKKLLLKRMRMVKDYKTQLYKILEKFEDIHEAKFE